MNGLIWVPRVSLRRLARAQEGKERVWKVKRHKLRDGEHAVVHREPAGEAVAGVLLSVARHVQDRRSTRGLKNLVGGGVCQRGAAALGGAGGVYEVGRRYGADDLLSLRSNALQDVEAEGLRDRGQ